REPRLRARDGQGRACRRREEARAERRRQAHVPRRDLAVVPEDVGSSGPPWRLSAVKGSSTPRRSRMNLHANAALSWTGRKRLCELVVVEGWTVAAAAAASGVSVRCARKWI